MGDFRMRAEAGGDGNGGNKNNGPPGGGGNNGGNWGDDNDDEDVPGDYHNIKYVGALGFLSIDDLEKLAPKLKDIEEIDDVDKFMRK